MLVQDLPSRGLVPDVLVDVLQQVAVSAACVNDKLRLLLKLLASKDFVHMPHQVLEESLMLRSATNNIQSPLHVDLSIVWVEIFTSKSPARIFVQDLMEAGQKRRVGGGHVVGVDPLHGKRTLGGH